MGLIPFHPSLSRTIRATKQYKQILKSPRVLSFRFVLPIFYLDRFQLNFPSDQLRTPGDRCEWVQCKYTTKSLRIKRRSTRHLYSDMSKYVVKVSCHRLRTYIGSDALTIASMINEIIRWKTNKNRTSKIMSGRYSHTCASQTPVNEWIEMKAEIFIQQTSVQHKRKSRAKLPW